MATGQIANQRIVRDVTAVDLHHHGIGDAETAVATTPAGTAAATAGKLFA
jgi:hypothetical protein